MSAQTARTQTQDDAAKNKATTARFFDRVFNHGNMQEIDDDLSPEYTYNGQAQSKEQLKTWVTGLRAAYPDLHFNLQAILAEDSLVALRWHMTGTATDGDHAGQLTEITGTNIIAFNGQGLAVSNVQNGSTQYVDKKSGTAV